MILDQNRMRQLLQSGALASVMPEMASFAEQVRSVNNLVASGGCRSCQVNSKMAPIVAQAQQFIVGLSADRVAVLKTILGTQGRLFAYAPNNQGKPGLVELGL